MIGLSLHQPSERIDQPLVLQDHAAGNEIKALGRFVVAQTKQHVIASVADDQIDGNERRETDDRVQFGVIEEAWRHWLLS